MIEFTIQKVIQLNTIKKIKLISVNNKFKGDKIMRINHPERLEGLNIKVISGTKSCYSEDRVGQVYKIHKCKYGEHIHKDKLYMFVGEDGTKDVCFVSKECKITLDDTFFDKLKLEDIAICIKTIEDYKQFVEYLWDNNTTFPKSSKIVKGIDEKVVSFLEGKEPVYLYFIDNWFIRGQIEWPDGFSHVSTKRGFTIIDFKDCIFLNKFNIGDTVKVIEAQDGAKGAEGLEGTLVEKNASKNRAGLLSEDKSDYFVKVGQWVWSIGEKDKVVLELIKTKEDKPMNTYKIIKDITLENIIKSKPCNSDGELWELMLEFRNRDLDYKYKVKDYKDFCSFKVMKKYKSWFLEKKFLERVEDIELKLGMNLLETLTNISYRVIISDQKTLCLTPNGGNNYSKRVYLLGNNFKIGDRLSELNKNKAYGVFKIDS